MENAKIFDQIKTALRESPRNAYVAELHLQVIKYAVELSGVTGKEFCERASIQPSYATEYMKMMKIAERLRTAGVDPSKI